MFRILATLCAVLCATTAPAQSTGLVTLSTGQDGRGWEGVGRLDITDKGFCTASLIREDLILTAAHCVYENNGTAITADRFTFNAGLRGGRAEAYRGVKRVVAHPDYHIADRPSAAQVSHDIAVLQLDQPIRTTRIRPYAINRTPESGEEIGVVSYARGREGAPSLQQLCEVIDKRDGVVIMTCSVTFGASGSPVVRMSDGTPQIVSVIAAMSKLDGEPVSLGTSLDRPLAELLAYFDSTGTTLPGAIRPGARNETGAKFIRP